MAEKKKASVSSAEFPWKPLVLAGAGALGVALLPLFSGGPPPVPVLSEAIPVLAPSIRQFTVGPCGPNWEPKVAGDIRPVGATLTRLNEITGSNPVVRLDVRNITTPLLRRGETARPVGIARGDITQRVDTNLVNPNALLLEPDTDDAAFYGPNWKKAFQQSGTLTLSNDLDLTVDRVSPINARIVSRWSDIARVRFNLPGIPNPVCSQVLAQSLNLPSERLKEAEKSYKTREAAATRWKATSWANETSRASRPTRSVPLLLAESTKGSTPQRPSVSTTATAPSVESFQAPKFPAPREVITGVRQWFSVFLDKTEEVWNLIDTRAKFLAGLSTALIIFWMGTGVGGRRGVGS